MMKLLVKWFGIAAAGVYGVYVIGVSVALHNGALQKLSADWEDAHVSAASGWSLWPGTVHLTDASISFQDYNIEVQVSAAKLAIDVAVWSTLFGSVHVEGVQATGASYRMLHRVTDGHGNRERLAAFPDILEFDRAPIYQEPKPPYVPLSRRIRVENIEAEVVEAWFLEYRAVGKMYATGGFEIFRDVRVLPSRVTFEDARVLVGGTEFVDHARCELSAVIGPFDRETGGLLEVLAVTGGEVNCDAHVADISVAEIYMPDFPAQVLGTGAWKSKLQLNQGRIVQSTAELSARFAPLRLAGNALLGDLHLTLNADAAGVLQTEAAWSETKPAAQPPAQSPGQPAAKQELFVAELEAARLKGTWDQRQLTQLTPRNVALNVEGLSWFDPVLLRNLTGPRPPPSSAGDTAAVSRGASARDGALLNKVENLTLSASYQAQKNGSPDAQSADVSAQASGAVVLFPSEGQQVSCALDAKVECRRRPAEVACSHAALNCKPLSVHRKAEEGMPLEASVATEDLLFKEQTLTSTIQFKTSNPRSIIHALADPDFLGSLGLALIPFGDLSGTVSIHSEQGTILGKVPAFTSGGLDGRGSFVIATGMESLWSVETPLGRFGVEQKATGVSIHPLVGEDWLNEQTAKRAQ